jgi:carbon-monoxide dehydrogenase medium subunit
MKPCAFEYIRPASLSEVLVALAGAHGRFRPIAGGQSLIPMLNLRLARPETLIDLFLLKELRGIAFNDDGVSLGALSTHAQVEDGVLGDFANGYLDYVAAGIAYRAIRNHGTLAGSLAHADPVADWPTALSALDAHLVLVSAKGTREINLSDFFIAPFTTVLDESELIQCINIPMRSKQTRWAYIKLARKVGEFAQSIVAVVVDHQSAYARIVIGGLLGTPLILRLHTDDPIFQWRSAVPNVGILMKKIEPLVGEQVIDPIQLRIHATALKQALEALK